MAIRTPEQYLASLKDGRVVYHEGEKVEDVTRFPHLRSCAEISAMDYVLAQDKRYQKLLIEHDKKGEPYHFVFKPPTTVEDIIRRRDVIQLTARTCYGMPGGTKFTGIDALHSITAVTRRMDKKLGTSYAPRVEAFREECKKEDAAVAVAMTDVKGDRSLRPSKQKPHRDYYVRIVDERKDGIVVRGAKVHISWSPLANEIIVLPCRAMREDDKEYAVSFAVKPNANGLTIIAPAAEAIDEGNEFEYPLNAHMYAADSLVVFDNVFIPMERVFLKGEWEFAGDMTYMFTNFHRASADAYKVTENEILVGTAALMAEYNGLDKDHVIRDKLSWLVFYTEASDALGKAACQNCVSDPDSGLVYPDRTMSNCAKFFFADNYHQAIKLLQDITGGIGATIPSTKDYLNPVTRPYLDRYLGGKEGIATENRIRAIKLVKDLSSYWIQFNTLHGEGSLSAQRLSLYAVGDFERYKAAAKRIAGIKDGWEHHIFSNLPKFPMWRWND